MSVSHKRGLIVCVILVLVSPRVLADDYIPLVLVHGIDSDYTDFSTLQEYIKEDFPTLKFFSLDAFNDDWSRVSMWKQVPVFNDLLKNITDQYGEVNLLGYSQGGQMIRAIVETSNNHNIRNFISLSAPAMGEFGLPYLSPFGIFVNMTEDQVYTICYNELGQHISVCNYWNDPQQHDLYLSQNVYLPYINNEIKHNLSESYKNNFINLQKVVLAGSPDDGVIIPWQTAQYGFYDANFNVVPYYEQQHYKEDWFGFRTLDEQGKIQLCTLDNIKHSEWPRNRVVYEACVKPFIV